MGGFVESCESFNMAISTQIIPKRKHELSISFFDPLIIEFVIFYIYFDALKKEFWYQDDVE